ncbi:hypothetical protein [Rhizobium halophilum]|uniref:hypothetical protein n=1 Tax=Rhizobium halophilum TaxID=2846852 RepID=UPI001EFD648E|nr:hypothetical protein [Rhizobium halophilum]MCF6368331.1 hypothetical protein [Rhizobium halophilum]
MAELTLISSVAVLTTTWFALTICAGYIWFDSRPRLRTALTMFSATVYFLILYAVVMR